MTRGDDTAPTADRRKRPSSDDEAGCVGVSSTGSGTSIASPIPPFDGTTSRRAGCGEQSAGRLLVGAGEHGCERGPKLAAHSAVDEEVDGIAESDRQIDEQAGRSGHAVGHQHALPRVLDDQQDEEHGKRQLDQQQNTHDGDQHEGGRDAVAESPALAVVDATAGAAASRQQLAATPAGDAHRPRQRRVQHDQQRARHQVRQDHPQPEVGAEVQNDVSLDHRGEMHVATVHLRICVTSQSVRFRRMSINTQRPAAYDK